MYIYIYVYVYVQSIYIYICIALVAKMNNGKKHFSDMVGVRVPILDF
jgi:hypothetical protein